MSFKEEDFDGSNNISGYSDNDVTNNNSHSTRMQNTSNLSKAELRKSNKPIMEKRRRARINHCLNELKSLILEAMKKDPARHTKLEKADILEMTVKHLQTIQRQQLSLAVQTDPTVIHKFKTGFTECAEEVNRYIGQLEGIETGVRQRLSNHLTSCVSGLEQLGTFNNFPSGFRPSTAAFSSQYQPQPNPVFPLPQDVNNNGRIQMGGVQLIPSRLPTGELALVMPNSSNMPFFPPNIPAPGMDFASTFPRLSAFSKPNANSVRPHPTQTTAASSSSPPLSPISSISSCGDESMHTSSDFQSKTPPLQLGGSFSSVFPTPPSTESVKFVSHTGHLQQPHVSSTSELSNFSKVLNAINSDTEDPGATTTRKRSRPDRDSNGNVEEPVTKNPKIKEEDAANGNLTTEKESHSAEAANDNMWRPW